MESDDKPFVCTAPGCGQRFANNDHLESHKQKHQLSLKLPGLLKNTDLLQLADQTPTPTRFLENLEKEGLFQDLDNPFDQEFKKAAPNSEEHPSQAVTTTGNTTVNENSVIIINPPVSVSKPEISLPDIPIVAEAVVVSTSRPLTTLKEPPPVAPKTSNKSAPVSVLVRTAPHHQIPTVIPANIANASIPVPAALPVPGHLSRTTAQSSMPVSIPTPAIVSSPSASNPPSFIGNAKQRLKEQLRQHHNNNAISNTDNIISQAMTEAVDMVTSENRNGLSNHVAHSQIHHHQQQQHLLNGDHWDENDSEGMSYGQKDKKRPRRTQEELDPDERRRKFLERNRAAATRCREKRKIWVQQLEKKADDLCDTNTQLQNEISLLKSEVAQLKSLLLAHKDCPVTLAQQKLSVQNPMGQGNVQTRTNGGHVQVTETANGLAVTVTRTDVTAEDVATTALTQMAQRAMGDHYGGQSTWASAE